MTTFIEFTKNLLMLHDTLDLFFGFDYNDISEDAFDDKSIKPQKEILHNDLEDLDNLDDFYIIGNFLITSFLGVCSIFNKINIFIFNILFSSAPEQEIIKDDKPEKPQPINYNEKYDSKYTMLEKIILTEENISLLPNNIVMDTTPNGNVIMFFDNSKKSFQYYSDFSIPYSYLESVSKKYCIMNKNSIFRELKMDIDVVNEFAIVKNQTTRPQSKCFASLKTYNSVNPNFKTPSPNVSGKPRELKIIQKDIVRYTHLGKLGNFNFLKNTQPRYKKISYKDFGKIQ